jgi:hypothetical protein
MVAQMVNGTISLRNSLGLLIDCELHLRHITVNRPNRSGLGLPQRLAMWTAIFRNLISLVTNSRTGAIESKYAINRSQLIHQVKLSRVGVDGEETVNFVGSKVDVDCNEEDRSGTISVFNGAKPIIEVCNSV